MTILKNGDIFANRHQVLVNPTNSIGPMGAGLAAQFRDRFPGLEQWYKAECAQGAVKPGMVREYETPIVTILCAATKDHWKEKSNPQWVNACYANIRIFLDLRGDLDASIGVPLLGAGLGGIKPAHSEYMACAMLADLPHDIYLYTR